MNIVQSVQFNYERWLELLYTTIGEWKNIKLINYFI